MREGMARSLAAGLGIGAIGFGIMPVLVPRRFARLFGFPPPDAATVSMMRSLGVRDAVMGLGLWSAAAHGGSYAPWLLARLLTDGGDVVAVGVGAAAGARHPRFLLLGGLALGAATTEAALYWAARRASGAGE